MEDQHDPRSILTTERQRAVYAILSEAGFREGQHDGEETEPEGLALILDDVLATNPTEEQLLDAMTWGQHRELWGQLRPIAQRLLAVRDV